MSGLSIYTILLGVSVLVPLPTVVGALLWYTSVPPGRRPSLPRSGAPEARRHLWFAPPPAVACGMRCIWWQLQCGSYISPKAWNLNLSEPWPVRSCLIHLYLSRFLRLGPVLAVSHLVCHFWSRWAPIIFLATILPSGSSYMSAPRRCSPRMVGWLRFILYKWIRRSRYRVNGQTGRHAVDVVAYALVALIRTCLWAASHEDCSNINNHNNLHYHHTEIFPVIIWNAQTRQPTTHLIRSDNDEYYCCYLTPGKNTAMVRECRRP